MTYALAVAALAAVFALTPVHDAAARDRTIRAEFHRTHPCPSTGLTRGRCPGYVVDHIVALCAGGPDTVANMQWQEYHASLVKDREERRQCADMRRVR